MRANLVSCRRIKSGLFWRQTYTKEIGRAKNPINQKFISYRRRDQQRGKVATPEETRIQRWMVRWMVVVLVFRVSRLLSGGTELAVVASERTE